MCLLLLLLLLLLAIMAVMTIMYRHVLMSNSDKAKQASVAVMSRHVYARYLASIYSEHEQRL